MATNQHRWIRNLQGAPEPLVLPALFQAGSTQAIKRGEILELTGDTNTAFVPIDSDFLMLGHIAVANEEIKAGDRAGYYTVIVPRPGDVFEFELATAAALTVTSRLYYSSSEKVTTTGTYVLGTAVGFENYPFPQGHLADDASGDAGTTVKSTSYARMVFSPSASYYARLQRAGEAIDLGDAGGHSGFSWDSANTQVLAWIDGTNVADFGADGAWSDLIT